MTTLTFSLLPPWVFLGESFHILFSIQRDFSKGKEKKNLHYHEDLRMGFALILVLPDTQPMGWQQGLGGAECREHPPTGEWCQRTLLRHRHAPSQPDQHKPP